MNTTIQIPSKRATSGPYRTPAAVSSLSRPWYTRRAAHVLIALVLALSNLSCHLTPAQSAILQMLEKPFCDLLGASVSAIPVAGATADQIVGYLCEPVANDVIMAESTPAPAPTVVKTAVPVNDAGVPVGAVAPVEPVVPAATASSYTVGCKPVLIPNDPLHQSACPELHAAIMASEARVMVRLKAAAKGVGAPSPPPPPAAPAPPPAPPPATVAPSAAPVPAKAPAKKGGGK